jgi:hypothetical protein
MTDRLINILNQIIKYLAIQAIITARFSLEKYDAPI